MVLSGYGLSGYGLSGYGLSGYGTIGIWSLSLNSGFGMSGKVAVGLIMKFPLTRDNGRGNQKRGDASTDKVRGDASTDKERGTPAQTRKGGRQHRQGGGQNRTKSRGGAGNFFAWNLPLWSCLPTGQNPCKKPLPFALCPVLLIPLLACADLNPLSLPVLT